MQKELKKEIIEGVNSVFGQSDPLCFESTENCYEEPAQDIVSLVLKRNKLSFDFVKAYLLEEFPEFETTSDDEFKELYKGIKDVFLKLHPSVVVEEGSPEENKPEEKDPEEMKENPPAQDKNTFRSEMINKITEAIGRADPHGLIKDGAPKDEYKPEAVLIFKKVILQDDPLTLDLVRDAFAEMFDFGIARPIDEYIKTYEEVKNVISEIKTENEGKLTPALLKTISKRISDLRGELLFDVEGDTAKSKEATHYYIMALSCLEQSYINMNLAMLAEMKENNIKE